jgi:hypothetical protein
MNLAHRHHHALTRRIGAHCLRMTRVTIHVGRQHAAHILSQRGRP